MSFILSAKQAYEQSNRLRARNIEKELANEAAIVSKKIQASINNGETSCDGIRLSNQMVKVLQAKGYRVRPGFNPDCTPVPDDVYDVSFNEEKSDIDNYLSGVCWGGDLI